jgi:hypothetical protein
MHDGVYVGRLLSGKYVGLTIARVPSASFDVLQFLQFPKINHRYKKKLMLVRLPSGIAFVVSCLARTATYGLLRRLLSTLNYHPSKMRALRSPNPDPFTPFIWSCAGHESLPSIPTAPICHKSIIPSVLAVQEGPGTPSNDLSCKQPQNFSTRKKNPVLDLIFRSIRVQIRIQNATLD